MCILSKRLNKQFINTFDYVAFEKIHESKWQSHYYICPVWPHCSRRS